MDITATDSTYRAWLNDKLPQMAVNSVFPDEMRPMYNPQPATPAQPQENRTESSFNSTNSFTTVSPAPNYSPPLFQDLSLNSQDTQGGQTTFNFGSVGNNQTQHRPLSETQRLPTQQLQPKKLFARCWARK